MELDENIMQTKTVGQIVELLEEIYVEGNTQMHSIRIIVTPQIKKDINTIIQRHKHAMSLVSNYNK